MESIHIFIGGNLSEERFRQQRRFPLSFGHLHAPFQKLLILKVGANCVRPQTTMFIDNLQPFFKRGFLNNAHITSIKV